MPTIEVTPRGTADALSVDEIIARRLADEPFGLTMEAFPVKEPGKWAIRIANPFADEAKHYKMVYSLGYLPVTVDDLPDGISPASIGFRTAEDGRTLVRGIRGEEIAYKMEKSRYEAIQRRKAEHNLKTLRSERAAREDVLNAVAGAHGGSAAEFMKDHISINLTDHRQ